MNTQALTTWGKQSGRAGCEYLFTFIWSSANQTSTVNCISVIFSWKKIITMQGSSCCLAFVHSWLLSWHCLQCWVSSSHIICQASGVHLPPRASPPHQFPVISPFPFLCSGNTRENERWAWWKFTLLEKHTQGSYWACMQRAPGKQGALNSERLSWTGKFSPQENDGFPFICR